MCVHLFMCICICVRMCICVHVCVCMYTHVRVAPGSNTNTVICKNDLLLHKHQAPVLSKEELILPGASFLVHSETLAAKIGGRNTW